MTPLVSAQSRHILLTGASGFVGRHVAAALLERGHAVVLLDIREPAPELSARCARVLVGDIADAAVRRDALEGAQAICHLSAYLPSRLDDPGEAERCYRVNALATLDLARDAATAGVERFVYLSGANIYAPSAAPCTERSPVYPAGYAAGYLVSKLAGELYAAHVCARSSMAGIMLRAGTPYGPGEPDRKVIPTFLRTAEQGGALRLAAGGAATFSFVHVADLAECVARAAETGGPGVYNVASGEHTTLRQVAEAVAALHPAGRVAIEAEPSVPGAFAGFPPLDVSLARTTWNWAPRGLAQGLRDYRLALATGSRR